VPNSLPLGDKTNSKNLDFFFGCTFDYFFSKQMKKIIKLSKPQFEKKRKNYKQL
jgi:hypothetical protein